MQENISLNMLATLGIDNLQSAFGDTKLSMTQVPAHAIAGTALIVPASCEKCSRIIAAIGSEPLKALAPPPKGPKGEPYEPPRLHLHPRALSLRYVPEMCARDAYAVP